MSLIQTLLARFARPVPPVEADAFAMRLQRIQQRETRIRLRRGLFRA